MSQDPFGLVGSVLDGRYRIEHVVGEGGFGVVYRGFHLGFEKPIAIKCLKIPQHFTLEASSTFVARFRDEGKLLSHLSESPGVVRVYDFGVTATGPRGQLPYLVLEWLDGQTLEEHLAQRKSQRVGPCLPLEAVQMLLPAIEALAFAHSLRVAHRDIKPANLFLAHTTRGISMKVLDFGIAKAMQEGESQTRAATGTASGFHAFSPMYGAPEQFFSKRYGASGPWTDVHALGLVLVEMVTGRVALQGDDPAELLEASTREQRPTPRAFGVDVPEGLEWLCARALARMPAERFQDAGQMLEAIRQMLGTTGSQASYPGYPTPIPSAVGATVPASGPGYADMRPSSPAVSPPFSPAYSPAYSPGVSPVYTPTTGPSFAPDRPSSPAMIPGAGVPPGVSTTHSPWTAAAPPVAHAGADANAYGATQLGTPYPASYVSTPLPTHAQRGSPEAFSPAMLPGASGSLGSPGASDPSLGSSQGAGVAGGSRTATPGKRRIWPYVLGMGALVGGCGLVGSILGASMLFNADDDAAHHSGAVGGPGGPGGPGSSGDGAHAAGGLHDGAQLVRQVTIGKSVLPVLPLTAAEARGKWHVRLQWKGGHVVHLESVNPAGNVAKEIRVDRANDGTRTLHVIDSNHIETEVNVIKPDGTSTTTSRAGVVSTSGCYRVRESYDVRGRVEQRTCVGPTGFVIIDDTGCQIRKFTSDAHDLVETQGCFSEDGKPLTDQDGIHLTKTQHDADGNVIEVAFFDERGGATARLSDGCARLHTDRDTAGNAVAERCLDTSGRPRVMQGRTWSARLTTVDASGCTTRVKFVDASGQPSLDGDIAEIATTPDGRCNTTREERRGAKGQLIKPGAWGVPLTTMEVGGDGLVQSKLCFGADEKPTNCEGNGSTTVGVRARFSYDDRGRLTSERYFAPDGALSATSHVYPHETRLSYGADGRVATRAFFDDKGKPATALGKVARFSYRYDPLGGLLSSAMFGTDGKPVSSSIGCHDIVQVFDDHHRLSSVECHGPSGDLAAHVGLIYGGVDWPAGASRVTIERGASAANLFTDVAGKLVKRVDCGKRETPCYR